MSQQSDRKSRPSSLLTLCFLGVAMLAFHGLVPRPLMAAGEVITQMTNGLLVIDGDGNANRIEVTQSKSYLEVTGVDTKVRFEGRIGYQVTDNLAIFPISGTQYEDIYGLVISLDDGDDHVAFPDSGGIALDNISINMGYGRDSVSGINLDLSDGANIYSYGHLSVDLQNSVMKGFLGINAEEIVVRDTRVGLGDGDNSYGTFLLGADSLVVTELQTSDLLVTTNSGNGFGVNTVTMNGLYVAYDAHFDGDFGDDTFGLYNALFEGDVTMKTFDSNDSESPAVDRVELRNVTVIGSTSVETGPDRLGDSFQIRDCLLGRSSFQPGNGANELLVEDLVASYEFTYFGGVDRDVVNFDSVDINGDVRVYTSSGDDTVDLKGARAIGSLIVQLGAGNDVLAISNQSSAQFADLDGGSNSRGIDSLMMSGRFDRTDITGFENNSDPILQIGTGEISGGRRW
ncbi:hypothetical protein [Aporhodopirellula aestuarii]|uniref:Uncharacterized protein n=1 Tax=Aporhodopirellula aestuarii TaxID=2950107 RepID=A0ABT0U624_9BACT|nr:hypothetical protein [Aporhodopirellula aestuarii]MCM2372114.1 hypothetical protein [Aporhodopirellula aestuarii]